MAAKVFFFTIFPKKYNIHPYYLYFGTTNINYRHKNRQTEEMVLSEAEGVANIPSVPESGCCVQKL